MKTTHGAKSQDSGTFFSTKSNRLSVQSKWEKTSNYLFGLFKICDLLGSKTSRTESDLPDGV